jgi:hypothetical protein
MSGGVERQLARALVAAYAAGCERFTRTCGTESDFRTGP